jgi:hypothetical protein
MNSSFIQKAREQAELLQKTNLIVARIAIVVYLVICGIALYYRAWILVLFSTCLLLAVRVVYLFIATVLTHLELMRENNFRLKNLN